ncbi:MAG: isoprenylcysteine carboxylmethyltransferase family protein [Desulfobacteraceae bacterium]|nr:MAG: isoprenylcysteine carboxylmethyltransferase family protein [Desulfobacteraceae bacterium]
MRSINSVFGYAMIFIAAAVAQVSLLGLGVFLFFGAFELVALDMGHAGKLIFNAFLSLLFFAQHSGMLRKGFRARLEKYIGTPFLGAVFTIASGVVLLVVLIFWQQTPPLLFSAQEIGRWLMRGLYFLMIAAFAWGGWSLQPFDPMGLSAVVNRLRGRSPAPPQLSIRGPYRWVRHPLYLFSILMIWSCPDITADRLLFNVMWTVWIIAGAFLEERDLAACFGEAYRQYQRNVPMLIPRTFRPVL